MEKYENTVFDMYNLARLCARGLHVFKRTVTVLARKVREREARIRENVKHVSTRTRNTLTREARKFYM